LTYYNERNLAQPKGVIHLLKCDIRARDNGHDENENGTADYHFTIHHSMHGSKHLYAENSNALHKWITVITNVVEESTAMGGMEGFLKKRGGLRLHTWQSRWFMLMGSSLCWYEKASDSYQRGEIILNSKVNAEEVEGIVGGENHVFVIIDGGRTDFKARREFACETITDLHFWVSAINKSVDSQKRVSNGGRLTVTSSDERDSGSLSFLTNKVKDGFNGMMSGVKDDLADLAIEEETISLPESKEGILQKHNSWGVYQKRLFEVSDGELRYYKNVEERTNVTIIYLVDLLKGSPSVDPHETSCLFIATKEKILKLKASGTAEANEWEVSIKQWKAWLANEDWQKII